MGSFSVKTAAWRAMNATRPGKELVWLESGGARGSLLNFDEEYADLQRPYQLNYRYLWDDSFCLTQATIEVSFRGETSQLHLSRRDVWANADGAPLASADCVDLDLWPSPLTNTLALRRLGLRIGERKDVAVLFIEAPTLAVRRDLQTYTRLDEREFYFESANTGFRALLTVDDDLLVNNYPGLFKREA